MIPCSECDTPFRPRNARELTCSMRCGHERGKRVRRATHALRARDRYARMAAAKRTVPSYAVEIERHQKQLRRIWNENGLPLDSLLNWPVYHGGFTSGGDGRPRRQPVKALTLHQPFASLVARQVPRNPRLAATAVA